MSHEHTIGWEYWFFVCVCFLKSLIEIVLMIRQFLIGPYSIKLITVSYGFARVPRHEKSIGNGATAEQRWHHHITMALCDTIIVFETFILLLALLCIVLFAIYYNQFFPEINVVSQL